MLIDFHSGVFLVSALYLLFTKFYVFSLLHTPPPGVLVTLGSLMLFLIFLLVIFWLVLFLCVWIVVDSSVQYGQ